MQDIDYKWFVNNYQKIYEEYGKTYVAISNEKILGHYDSYVEAVRETLKTLQLGEFIVQYCNGDESAYTGYIASMNFRQVKNYA